MWCGAVAVAAYAEGHGFTLRFDAGSGVMIGLMTAALSRSDNGPDFPVKWLIIGIVLVCSFGAVGSASLGWVLDTHPRSVAYAVLIAACTGSFIGLCVSVLENTVKPPEP